MPQPYDADTLLNLGFRDAGAWHSFAGGARLDYGLDGQQADANEVLLASKPALYAFVVGSDVRYIGKTAQTLRARLNGYRSPSATQSTNLRCNRKIRSELAAARAVRIFVFDARPQLIPLRFGDFRINLAAGLEDALIEAFDPAWNGRDHGVAMSETAEREQASGEAGRSHALVETGGPLPEGVTSFVVQLGRAYFEQGLINPGRDASAHLGDHDDPVTVYLGGLDRSLLSRIDRRANANGSVRIIGNNSRIGEWVRANYRLGDAIQARVLDRHHILLMPKC